jgi:hypothetical protein
MPQPLQRQQRVTRMPRMESGNGTDTATPKAINLLNGNTNGKVLGLPLQFTKPFAVAVSVTFPR